MNEVIKAVKVSVVNKDESSSSELNRSTVVSSDMVDGHGTADAGSTTRLTLTRDWSVF